MYHAEAPTTLRQLTGDGDSGFGRYLSQLYLNHQKRRRPNACSQWDAQLITSARAPGEVHDSQTLQSTSPGFSSPSPLHCRLRGRAIYSRAERLQRSAMTYRPVARGSHKKQSPGIGLCPVSGTPAWSRTFRGSWESLSGAEMPSDPSNVFRTYGRH